MTFTASDKEVETAGAWMLTHMDSCAKAQELLRANNIAAVGVSPFSWVFTETSIAMSVHVRCIGCGTEEDVSDVESW